MSEYQEIIGIIAMSMGAAWASGINLYAAILVLGIMGLNGDINLPPDLQVLAHPMVIAAAGLMYMVEFTADKIPGVDSAWDALHTLVRVPAGAMLAAGAVGDLNPSIVVAAGILGGGVAMGTHAAKAGTRVLINTSPEPMSNWGASITEDLAVLAGLWTALNHPGWFLIFFIVFVLFLIWVLPKLWSAIKKVFAFIRSKFSFGRSEASNTFAAHGETEKTAKENQLSQPLFRLDNRKK